MDLIRASFSLVPEYPRTVGDGSSGGDYSEYQPQLGRRFRALKLWFLLRAFGLSELRARSASNIAMAAAFAARVDTEPDAERLAPVPFSIVCFRWRPTSLSARELEASVARGLDSLNERLMEAVNASGVVFLSHTRLSGRFALRVAINQSAPSCDTSIVPGS